MDPDLDAVVNDWRGAALTLNNAICIHEEDDGILWKHLDWRTGLTEVRLGIGGDCRHVVVADNTDERATGLMRRNDLGSYDGMLFVFDRPTISSFTMSDVPVPLDIAWYDAAGRPVDRLLMQPCPDGTVSDCPAYSSQGTYSYAVETLGGELPGGALSACP